MIFSRQIIKFVITEFLYNGHLQSFGALGVFVFSSLLLGKTIKIIELVSIYLTFYLIYLYNRYRENKTDYLTNKIRSCHVKILSPYIKPVFAAGLAVLIALILYSHNFYFAFWLTIIFVGGVHYTDIFKSITKKILAFKNFYVALVFTLLALLPLIINNESIKLTGFVLSLFVFWRALKMQIALDLKDIKSDSFLKLKTFGALYGKKGALIIILGVDIVNWAIFIFFSYYLQWSFIVFLVLFSAIFDLINYYIFRHRPSAAFLFASSEFIFLPLLVIIN